jgi:4-amino-4-deoxy-L-arabinose transferase-like glycosyltransferase
MSTLPTFVDACKRYYPAFAAGVLLLAAFNLGFRLDREPVRQWDESLYATSAWEMITRGNWIATTFRGSLDYYNSKPPLNIWLIVGAFKIFGVNLAALRIASAFAAWLTVAVLMWWVRRVFGTTSSVLSGLTLSTNFAFLIVHSGRSAETDALYTLLVLLTVITLWAAWDRPWRLTWLGPILAAVFLLRGMAILMPAAIILVVEAWPGRSRRQRWRPAACALLLMLVPVVAWAMTRWQVDEWRFLHLLFWYDFVERSVTTIEEHQGSVLYYLNILVKHHYEWLLAALLALALFPPSWSETRDVFRWPARGERVNPLLIAWAGVTIIMPTVMVTKLPWYLNPFYPVCAIGVASLFGRAFTRAATEPARSRRSLALGVIVVLALGVAEGKLIWYSYHYRDLGRSTQGLLIAQGAALQGRQVFCNNWDRSEMFVIEALLRATHRLATDVPDFLSNSRPGDYFLSPREVSHPGLTLAGSVRRHWLYRRNK